MKYYTLQVSEEIAHFNVCHLTCKQTLQASFIEGKFPEHCGVRAAQKSLEIANYRKAAAKFAHAFLPKGKVPFLSEIAYLPHQSCPSRLMEAMLLEGQ